MLYTSLVHRQGQGSVLLIFTYLTAPSATLTKTRLIRHYIVKLARYRHHSGVKQHEMYFNYKMRKIVKIEKLHWKLLYWTEFDKKRPRLTSVYFLTFVQWKGCNTVQGQPGLLYYCCIYFLAKLIFMAVVGVILKPCRASLAAADCISFSNSTNAMSWRPGTRRTLRN